MYLAKASSLAVLMALAGMLVGACSDTPTAPTSARITFQLNAICGNNNTLSVDAYSDGVFQGTVNRGGAFQAELTIGNHTIYGIYRYSNAPPAQSPSTTFSVVGDGQTFTFLC